MKFNKSKIEKSSNIDHNEFKAMDTNAYGENIEGRGDNMNVNYGLEGNVDTGIGGTLGNYGSDGMNNALGENLGIEGKIEGVDTYFNADTNNVLSDNLGLESKVGVDDGQNLGLEANANNEGGGILETNINPLENQVENPTENPTENPIENPIDNPIENQIENQIENPIENLTENLTEAQPET